LLQLPPGLLLGMEWEAIIAGLRDESAQLRLLAVPGVNQTTLIDDTYNASPALDAGSAQPAGRP
jgi:UDP-N-acetylmuramoyl-tripeptide--D-alanyl-D-alanine ligase (EC 6.3.2.10)